MIFGSGSYPELHQIRESRIRPPSAFWSRKIVAIKASTVSLSNPAEVSDDFVFSPSISSMLNWSPFRARHVRARFPRVNPCCGRKVHLPNISRPLPNPQIRVICASVV
jgi:hypothetical protein